MRAAGTAGAVALAVLPLLGVASYTASTAHGRHDPQHALQQLDLLYLDEPAPFAARLRLPPGRLAVVVVCPGPAPCPLPALDGAAVVGTSDPAVAEAYALTGRTGYALVDRRGHVRYRTVDPDPAAHAAELRVLVAALQ